MIDKMFEAKAVREALDILVHEFPLALWETAYVTVLATAFAIVLGLPLGVLLVAGEKDGVLPLPRPVMQVLNVIINLLRSIPFLILMIMACACQKKTSETESKENAKEGESYEVSLVGQLYQNEFSKYT